MLKQSPTSLNRISHECAISMIECVLEKGVKTDKNADPLQYQAQALMRYNTLNTQQLSMRD